MTQFPINVTIARLLEFHQLADALCQQELGRLPSHTVGDPVAEMILLMALNGETGPQIQAWLHEQPEAIAYRTIPPIPSLPGPHTREDAAGIRTHFQGLEFPLAGGVYRDVLIWSDNLTEADRVAAYQVHLDAGDRHMVCNLSALYHPTQALPIAGTGWDYTRNLPLFKARLREMITRGLIPLCALAGDGQDYNPDGGTYGWHWLMANLPRIASALKGEPGSECPDGEDFLSTRLMVPFLGFELVTPPGGNWTPDQFFQAHLLARQVFGSHAVIAAEIGAYAWPGEGTDIRGNAMQVMSSEPMLAIDVLLGEWNNPGDPERQDGMEQIASRWLGPDARHIQAKNAGPWYLAVQTSRGPRVAVAFERCLYVWVRNGISKTAVEEDADAFRALGFRYVS